MKDTDPSGLSTNLLAHAAWVRRMARALVLDQSRVDDVVQQTWLAALEERPRRVLHPRAWLMGIARNVVKQDHRAERRRLRREARSARHEPLPSTEQLVERAETQKRVAQAVLDLPDPYRQTLLLRFFEDLSCEEIARRLDVPGSTIRNRQMRALAMVRKHLDRTGDRDGRTWCLDLIPLALPARGAAAAMMVGGWGSVLQGVGTMKAIVAAAVILFAGVGVTYAVWGQPPDTDSQATDKVGTAFQQADRSAGKTEQSPPAREPVPARIEHFVRGNVTDTDGAAVPQARVFVGGQPSPFEGEPDVAFSAEGHDLEGGLEHWGRFSTEELQAKGILFGKFLSTDAGGHYEARFATARRVFVCAVRSTGIRAIDTSRRWVETPQDAADLVVARVPISTISVWLTDLSTGRRLDEFRGTLEGPSRRSVPWASETAVYERALEVPQGGETATVRVTEPVWAQSSRTVVLAPGAHQDVEFQVASAGEYRGLVTDADGNPLPAALVYWGDLTRMLGRGWFAHHDPGRVFDGVKTDEHGRYVLPGSAPELTVWHQDHSPVTVATTDGGRVSLPPRGEIRGVVLDDGGQPQTEVKVVLDRERVAMTDAKGRYVFEKVTAGVHGVAIEGRRFLGVELAAGEILEIVLPALLESVEVRLLAGTEPYKERMGGGIFGLGPIFTVHEFGAQNGQFTLRNIAHGRYVLTSGSRFAVFEVGNDGDAVADLGGADLTARTQPGASVYLVPEVAAGRQQLLGQRLRVEADDTGEAVFRPLPAGRYAVGIVGQGILKTLDVGVATRISLP